MGMIKHSRQAPDFFFRPSTAFPQFWVAEGAGAPMCSLRFDGAVEETAYFGFRASNYPPGVALSIIIGWYPFTLATLTGGVTWGVSLAALSANNDAVDVESKAFGPETLFNDTNLGTVGRRPHDVLGNISGAALDELGLDDWVTARVARKTLDAGDTMSTTDAALTYFDFAYADAA